MALTVKQRGVLKGIIAGAAITFVVILGAILVGPMALPAEASAGERLAFAIRADAFIALWLAISIGLLARHRFFTPEDIDGGGLSRGSETANVLQSTLQNTLEQSVIAVLRSSSVVDSDAGILDIGDTSRRLPFLVWPCAICARVSWWGAISGHGVCPDLLPIRTDAHLRDRYSRMESVALEVNHAVISSCARGARRRSARPLSCGR
jgi:hypothetical protein